MWEMEDAGTVELAEGTPAMVKHTLLKEKERASKERYEHMAVARQEDIAV